MLFRFRELVGRYSLVVSDELRDFIERAFVAPAAEPDRERIRQEALREAALAEVEIEADGTLISRAGAAEFYRLKLAVTDERLFSLAFEKAPGKAVSLSLRDVNTLVAVQPGQPEAVFVRAPPTRLAGS
jgi:hypothetical protein